MKSNIVSIEGHNIERIEYRNQPVITLRMVDDLHGRPEGTARKGFNRNKKRFVKNKDYFRLPYDEWTFLLNGEETPVRKGGNRAPMIFLTQSGYCLLVKSFTDSLAWKIQRTLYQRAGFIFR